MQRNQSWTMGLLAGIAGGAMAYAGLHAGIGTIILLLLAPFSVYVAALGWGTVAGLTAAIVATAVTAVDANFAAPVTSGALLFFPAAWAGHLANLARRETAGEPGGREVTVWFPLSGILTRLMLALSAGILLTLWVLDLCGDELAAYFLEAMTADNARPADIEATEMETLRRTANIYAGMIPLAFPVGLLFMHVLIMHAAAIVVRLSGRLVRPPADIAATASLPLEAVVFPAAGLVGMLTLSGWGYSAAAVATGMGVAGFTLIGLAELHYISRGRPGRGFLLFISYFMLALFSFTLLIFAGLGLRRTIRNRHAPPTT